MRRNPAAAVALPLLVAGCVTGSPSRTYVSDRPVAGDAIACAAHDLRGSGYEVETIPGSTARGRRPLTVKAAGGEQRVGVVAVNLIQGGDGARLRAGASIERVEREPGETLGGDPAGVREGELRAAVDFARVEQDAARVVALCG